jgi:hypothetical protein
LGLHNFFTFIIYLHLAKRKAIIMGSKGTAFVEQLEVVMGKFVGRIVCQSIVKNQLSKLNKDKAALAAGDCKTLTQNIQRAVSLFVTREEAGRLQSEMDRLFSTHFPSQEGA